MVFPVVMYRCDSWTINKAEGQRIHAFKLWCWRRLLTVPWTGRRSNQSILKEISPEYSSEGLILKLQYFVKNWLTGKLTHRIFPWFWERLKAGGEGDDRGWDGWVASLTWWTWVWVSSGNGQRNLACCSPWGHKELYMTEWLYWKVMSRAFEKITSQIVTLFSDLLLSFLFITRLHWNLTSCLVMCQQDVEGKHRKSWASILNPGLPWWLRR